MKAKELIQRLQKYDPETDVLCLSHKKNDYEPIKHILKFREDESKYSLLIRGTTSHDDYYNWLSQDEKVFLLDIVAKHKDELDIMTKYDEKKIAERLFRIITEWIMK